MCVCKIVRQENLLIKNKCRMVLWVGDVVQLREYLPSSHKALDWITNTTEQGLVVVLIPAL